MKTIELTPEDDRTPLDKLLFDEFRREVPGLVERTLSVNPGLAAKGAFVPRGTRVKVPIPEGLVRTAQGGWETSG